jgi:hypothetical protein
MEGRRCGETPRFSKRTSQKLFQRFSDDPEHGLIKQTTQSVNRSSSAKAPCSQLLDVDD